MKYCVINLSIFYLTNISSPTRMKFKFEAIVYYDDKFAINK